jgi:hypothetical protein
VSANRIGGGGLSSLLNPFSPQWPTARPGEIVSVGRQVQQVLFGATKPPILDPAQFPMLAAQIAVLKRYRKKIVTMAGDEEDEYPMVLADGTIAMIDADGRIYMGVSFLTSEGDSPGTLVGVLAHEIGHRPKRWSSYRIERELSREEMEAICREEEARADAFAGMALAEMNLPPDPMIEFLAQIEEKPHPEYFPAKIRGEIIREAHAARSFRARFRKKMFPHLDRMTAPKNHLGDF